jgi:succinoglycan biosynthesis transport protein ExoP
MSRPSTLPVLARQDSNPVITPIVPLNFVYPGVTLPQIFSVIWGYRKVSFIIIAIVLAIVILTLKFWPRTYEAKVTLMVNYEVNDPVNGGKLPYGLLGSYIATQMELIQNPELLTEVVDQLHLTENKDYASGYNPKYGTLKEWVVHQVSNNLIVYGGQLGSQLIYVAFSAKTPNQATEIANKIAEIYKKQDDERAMIQPVERTARYAQELIELKKNVELAQQKVTDFHKQHYLDGEGKKAGVDVYMLTNLEERLLDAKQQRRLAEARVAGDQSASLSVLGSPEIQTLKARLAEQQLKLAKLGSLYTPDHPELLDLKDAIEVTKQSLANAIQKYATSESENYKAASELEQNLQVAVAKQRAKVFANSKLHDEAEKYVLALESAQAVYKRALDGYDQLKFASRRNNSNVSLISHATPPQKASKPKVLRGLIIGVFAAFMLGLGIPLGYELFNRRVRCRDDLERDHGIPVLAELGVPSLRATT